MVPLISVIIPVYNREHTLKRCVDSILQFPSPFIEVLLVDDCSSDGSRTIIQDYCNDKRVHAIFHELNKGVSAARNTGLATATGEYIMFVDSDDFIADDLLETITANLTTVQPDMLWFGHSIFLDASKQVFPVEQPGIEKDQLYNRQFITEKILPVMVNVSDQKEYFINAYTWDKVFKRDIIEQHHIRFDETRRLWEDRIFVVEYLKYAQSFFASSKHGYFYVMGHSAHRINMKNQQMRLKIILTGKESYQKICGNTYDWDCQYSIDYYSELIDKEILQTIDGLSLGKSERIEILENTFCHPNYIKWQKRRIPKNKFENKIKEAVLTHSDDIYSIYYHQACVLRKQQKPAAWTKIKSILRRILNKIKG